MLAYLTFIGVALLQICFINGEFEKFTVVVSFFSGIPNPQWSVSDNEELTGLLVESLKAGTLGHPSQMPARLGFRGILIEDEVLDLGKVLLLGSKSTELQMAILKTMPHGMLKQGDLDDIEEAINAEDLVLKEPPVFPVRGKRYAPPYQPAVWNALVPAYRRQRCNNCYNYATRRATDTFAQPGYGSGRIYTRNAGGGLIANPHTGANLMAAAQRDGLTQLNPHPGAAAPVPGAPAHAWRHLVALVVKPDTAVRTGDFHWYRLDNNGQWSHKPGETQVSQLDNANAPIVDPRNCALGLYVFHRFMVVDPLANRIGGNFVCPV